ncbi:MAG: cell wall hydrolase, partial [Lachnospiraceae bacterium]|nr:cell wall hydrolase [Lachnospiraceae bacterium]
RLERPQKAKAEKEKTEDAKEDTEDRKESLEITKNSLLGQLSTLNDELAQVSANLEGIEADIVEKELEIEQTEAQLEEAVRLQDEQYENMKLRIKAMYEQGGTDGYLSILFSSSGFSDFLNKSDYIDRVHAYDRKMLKKFQDTCKYVEETKVRLNEELVALNDLKAEAEEEKSRVAGLVSQTSANVSSYTSQIADAEATINALESMLDEQEQDIAALQKQYEEELAKSRLASHSKWRDISEVTFEEGDRKLMANIIYCEAGGEPYEGQVAVGAVVINRVLSSVYPNTVVGVIYQNKQFSPVASGRLALALTNDKATESCYRAADEAMSGVTNVGQCVYFRTPIPGLEGIRIGGHIFY